MSYFQNNKDNSPLLRTVFNDSPISMQTVARNGRIIFVNKAWQELWGLDDKSALWVMENYNIFEDKFVLSQNIDEAFRKALDGEVQNLATLLYVPEDMSLPGRQRWLDISFHPIIKENGEIDEVICLQFDVTIRQEAVLQKEKMFEELQKSIALRDHFISMASHELRTPLTSIKLQMKVFEQILSSPQLSTQDLAALANTAKSADSQVDRMTKLVEQMLDISRIAEGKLKIKHEDFPLTNLIEEVCERFQPMLKNLNISLSHKLKPNVHAHGDSFRIEQVLNNLLMNAVRYGGKTPITIELTTANKFARFSVNDQGPGIDSKDHTRIFRRFERAHDATQGDGLGLGLYLCDQIVRAQNGTIAVESCYGAGAKFIVELPLAHS